MSNNEGESQLKFIFYKSIRMNKQKIRNIIRNMRNEVMYDTKPSQILLLSVGINNRLDLCNKLKSTFLVEIINIDNIYLLDTFNYLILSKNI